MGCVSPDIAKDHGRNSIAGHVSEDAQQLGRILVAVVRRMHALAAGNVARAVTQRNMVASFPRATPPFSSRR